MKENSENYYNVMCSSVELIDTCAEALEYITVRLQDGYTYYAVELLADLSVALQQMEVSLAVLPSDVFEVDFNFENTAADLRILLARLQHTAAQAKWGLLADDIHEFREDFLRWKQTLQQCFQPYIVF